MINDAKKHMLLVTEIIVFITFILMCIGLFYLIKEFKKNDIIDNDNIVSVSNLNLNYILAMNLGMSIDVTLNDDEKTELYGLVSSLEFGPSETKCIIEPIYYLEYDENKLYLDESCGLAIYNDKTYSVTKGGKEISEFLKKKIDSLNNVYLFNFNQEKETAKTIEISDKDKDEIRKLWSLNDKNGLVLDLALIPNYVLFIDGDMLVIQELDEYINYLGEYISFSDELYNKLASFMNVSILRFSIDDYKDQIETFGPMFNKYKGTEIKTRDDAINNAKKLWKDYLKYEEYPLAYEVSYDALNDCYLVHASITTKNTVGGGAGMIIKSNGDVVTLWGED